MLKFNAFAAIFSRFFSKLATEIHKLFLKFRIFYGKDFKRKISGVCSIVYADSCHRNLARHLHNRKQRIHSAKTV